MRSLLDTSNADAIMLIKPAVRPRQPTILGILDERRHNASMSAVVTEDIINEPF